MADRYQFPGFRPFLDAAEVGVDDPSTLSHARRQPGLQAMASLCASACDAPDDHKAEIFAHALKARDGLAIAKDAADRLAAEVAEKLGLPVPPSPADESEAAIRGLADQLNDAVARAEAAEAEVHKLMEAATKPPAK